MAMFFVVAACILFYFALIASERDIVCSEVISIGCETDYLRTGDRISAESDRQGD